MDVARAVKVLEGNSVRGGYDGVACLGECLKQQRVDQLRGRPRKGAPQEMHCRLGPAG